MMPNTTDELWEWISYIMGTCSVLVWLCAQLPQIFKNWRRKSVEGLSTGFLVAWVAGDASNLLGCFLTNQLGVQILLASYYCVIDAILIAQFIAYRNNVEYIDGIQPPPWYDDSSSPIDNSNHTIQKPRSKSLLERFNKGLDSLSVVSSSLTLLSRAGAANGAAIPAAPEMNTVTGIAGFYWRDAIGYSVAYFSTVMYLTSRLPQILHNFQRKSTTGISMILFAAAFLGNLLYSLSIVLAPQSMGRDANQREFLIHELSYLLGASGTMFFDCIILGQWYWYQKILAHRRRSTGIMDRMSRPYLGTPSTSSVQRTLPPMCPSPVASAQSSPAAKPIQIKEPTSFNNSRRSSMKHGSANCSSSSRSG